MADKPTAVDTAKNVAAAIAQAAWAVTLVVKGYPPSDAMLTAQNNADQIRYARTAIGARSGRSSGHDGVA
jgi:hypothetical protein